MKALVKYANKPDCVEIQDMPDPQVSPDQVLLRVRAVGICGSDLEMYHHLISFASFRALLPKSGPTSRASSPETG
jgi:threonine dehydrogenase-like Zn-dependent dehydrogenase